MRAFEVWIYDRNICLGRHVFDNMIAAAEYLKRFNFTGYRFEINPLAR